MKCRDEREALRERERERERERQREGGGDKAKEASHSLVDHLAAPRKEANFQHDIFMCHAVKLLGG